MRDTVWPLVLGWSDMASCRQCDHRIRHREVFAWVNSGIESLECQGCGREITSSAGLTFLFFIWAILMVVAITYIHEIAFYIRGYGVDVPEIIVVLFVGFACVFMVYVSAFILASWKV
jgi:hypothetical protein